MAVGRPPENQARPASASASSLDTPVDTRRSIAEPGNRFDYDPRSRHEPGIVLYSRSGFGGRNVALDGNMPDLREIGFNDRASSLRVNWGVWEVCRDVNFGGRCARGTHSPASYIHCRTVSLASRMP